MELTGRTETIQGGVFGLEGPADDDAAESGELLQEAGARNPGLRIEQN